MPLDESTPDVGMRGEPSLDAIAALEPDLVVTTTDLPAEVIEQIEAEYPVIALRGSDASDPIGKMRSTLEILGEATGTSDAAEAALADFDAKVEDAKAAARRGRPGRRRLHDGRRLGRPTAPSPSACTRPARSSAALAGELGLENAWTGEGDPDYGLAQTDVEGLTELGDIHFLYVGNDTDGGDAFKDGLAGNAIWEQLPFVVAGNTTRLPDGIWLFGGPESGAAFIDATVAALTAG